MVRDALAAGENAVKYPLLAWGEGINPMAIRRMGDVWTVLVVGNVIGDAAATRRAMEMGLDVVALNRELAADA